MISPFSQNTREEVRIVGDGQVVGAISAQTGTHQQTFISDVHGPSGITSFGAKPGEMIRLDKKPTLS